LPAVAPELDPVENIGQFFRQSSLSNHDYAGLVVWRGKCASEPQSIAAVLRNHAPVAVRIGLETGPLPTWLFHELRKQDLPVICLDARHAKAALSPRVNVTGTNHGTACNCSLRSER
jgi:transposase